MTSELKVDNISNSSGTSAIGIDSNGNVGIGTTSPAKTLTVEASSDNIFLKQTSGNHGHILDQDNGDGSLSFIRRNSGTDTERMRIDSSGNIIFGKTTTDAMTQGGFMNQNGLLFLSRDNDTNLLINRFGGNGYVAQFRRDNANKGGISVTTTSTSFVTTSDHRLKENAVDMTGAITRVKNLQPKRFNFIADTTDTMVDGFMAHEAQTVVPEAVTGTHNEVDADGNPEYQAIDQSKLVPLLTGALQEAIAKIEALETRVTALENA